MGESFANREAFLRMGEVEGTCSEDLDIGDLEIFQAGFLGMHRE